MKKAGLFAWILVVFAATLTPKTLTNIPVHKPGDLGLIIAVTDDLESIQAWMSTPAKQPVTIKRIKEIQSGKMAHIIFIATGLSPDSKGMYGFSVNFYILGPDQKPIYGEKDFAKGIGALNPNPALYLGDQVFDLTFEQADPKGIYQVVAQITDQVSGKMTDASYPLEHI